MSKTLAVVLGSAIGAVVLVGLVIIFIWFYLFNHRSVSRTSESNSSDRSIPGRSIELSSRGGTSYSYDSCEAKCFTLEELNLATNNFSDSHLVGTGMFGEVYKGLLPGMLVAIKRRQGAPRQELIEEVRYLSPIRHRNLVSLLGYCQENDLQMLVYEYIPNGSVTSHLYGSSQKSSEVLEFKHRLSIASGAAKGLSHLHSLNPLLVHRDFKTANVLVDENFTPKVADAGLINLLDRLDGAGSTSRMMDSNFFHDPEAREFGSYSEKTDVYSFGIFLLELVSGREATQLHFLATNQSIVEWAQTCQELSNISTLIDNRMAKTFTAEGMKEFFQLIVWCLNPSRERRPPMSFIVSELERISDKEMSLTTIMGEGTPTVTLGSQLFKV